MIEWDKLIIAGLSGIGAGLFFFGGLWLTVSKGLHSKWPMLWFTGSFLLRTGVTILVFYYAGGGNWRNILACLAGFLAIKFSATLMSRKRSRSKLNPDYEHNS